MESLVFNDKLLGLTRVDYHACKKAMESVLNLNNEF